MRPIYEIAREIRKDWKNVSPYAAPYLSAMFCLDSIEDNYILDSGNLLFRYIQFIYEFLKFISSILVYYLCDIVDIL